MLLMLAAFLGAVGLVATVAGVAVAANPPPLDGTLLLAVTATNDYSSCVSAPGQVVPFGVASGVVTNDSPATAPYPGTFSASGSATLDPTTNKVTALSGTFSIHDATDSVDVSGTISLNGSVGSYAACDASGAFLAYTATITTPSTTCTDTGTAFIDTNDAGYFALYSFQSTSLTCGAPAPASPKEVLAKTSDDLKLLLEQNQMKPAAAQKIEDATAKLDQALHSTAWIGDKELAAKGGSTVFDNIQKAVIDTNTAAKLAAQFAAPLADAKDQMAETTKTIATDAHTLLKLLVPPVLDDVLNPTVALLEKGESQLKKADAALQIPDWGGNVIEFLKNSWAASEKGLALLGGG